MSIVKLRNIWFAISGALIIASIASLSIWGLDYDIDFTGGSLMEVSFEEQRAEKSHIEEAVINSGVETNIRIQEVGDDSYILRMRTLTEDEHQMIVGALENDAVKAQEQRFESIGPVIGQELKEKALRSIIVVLVAIVFYIAWAFRKVSRVIPSWQYGFIALVALFHDIIITMGIFAAFGYFFGYQVGLPFVAALLTILGYSVNDTIVIFDRVRENLLRQPSGGDFLELIDRSIKQNLSRSINTSLTTLFVLFMIFVFGGATMNNFIIALIIGISFGTYSSIFLASPLLYVVHSLKKS